MKRIIPVLLFMFLLSCAELVGASIKSLSPDKIGEFAAPGVNEDDDSYPYRADPKGKYYHFENFATNGCSQFCALEGYKEEFTATSTLAQIKSTTYGRENSAPLRGRRAVARFAAKGHHKAANFQFQGRRGNLPRQIG